MPNKWANLAKEKIAAHPRKSRFADRSPRHQAEHLNPGALARSTTTPVGILAPANILALQRTAGNRAVQQILGAMLPRSYDEPSLESKLMVGRLGDQHEQALAGSTPQVNRPPVLQSRSSTSANAVQLKPRDDAEEKLHPEAKSEFAGNAANGTGLPDNLKAGIENLSGFEMDDVRVHYNSPRPASLNALAFTQGTDIHMGPDQEKHLPHEAWHVVQQKQGRVKPTLQMKGVAINDDSALEKEATVMGEKAHRIGSWSPQRKTSDTAGAVHTGKNQPAPSAAVATVQRLDDNSVAYFMPKDPFATAFKEDHIVEAATDLTNTVAEARRAAKNKNTNTILHMTKDQGSAELKTALGNLVAAQDEKFVGKTYEWTTTNQYDWRSATRNAAAQNGNSKHKLGMQYEEREIKPATKRSAAQTEAKIRIMHWANTA